MGLSWQQGPLSTGAIGRFLVPEPLPKRLLYVELLRRRMRVRFGGTWIADSERVLLSSNRAAIRSRTFRRPTSLHTSSNAPTIPSSTPISGPRPGMRSGRASTSHHEGRGSTPGCLPTRANCRDGSRSPGRPWTHSMKKTNGSRAMPLTATTASTFAKPPAASWSAIVTAPSPILRVRSSSTSSGFAPRWYVQRADIDESALTPVKLQTFCPYKGLCSYYTIADARLAAWSYPDAYTEVRRISNLVSFEPDIVTVHLDDAQLHLEPGQEVTPHGPDRNLTVDEAARPAHLRERAPAGS